MGQVIRFPSSRSSARYVKDAVRHAGDADRNIGTKAKQATIIILPVIRIERYKDEADGLKLVRGATRRGRRRHVAR